MRNNEDFSRFVKLYADGELRELVSTDDGLFFLTLRSVARKENLLYVCEKAGIEVQGVPVRSLLPTIFLSNVSLELIEESIKELYEIERTERREKEKELLAELYKLRVFDWGGIYENDINKHIVNNYIKKITDYDLLVNKIENELLYSLKGFALCSWYNNWTSIIIEDIFKDHPRVLPTVGKIKQVDFFVDGIPFDLKMTYFPATFMEDQRAIKGYVRSELAELKRMCKTFNIPIDTTRQANDLMLDIITALSESSNGEVRESFAAFVARRKEIITETIAQPRTLLKWLYEKQGTQRFDASNRLFLITIKQDALEESWKLKRDYELLAGEITNYLDTRDFDPEEILLEWEVDGRTYESYTDVLFVVK